MAVADGGDTVLCVAERGIVSGESLATGPRSPGPADYPAGPAIPATDPLDDEAGKRPIRLLDRVEVAGGPYRGTDTRPPLGAQAPVTLR